MAADSSSFAFLTKSIPQWLRTLDHVRNSIAIQYLETPLPPWDQVEDVHRENAVSAKSPANPGNAFQVQNQQTIPSPTLANSKLHGSQLQRPTQISPERPKTSPKSSKSKWILPKPSNAKHAQNQQSLSSPTLANSRHDGSQLRQFSLPPKSLARPGNAFQAQLLRNTPSPTLTNSKHHEAWLQQNTPSPPLPHSKHHESQLQQPPHNSTEARPTSPQSSKRKRSSLTIISPEQSAPAKSRPRKKIEVYYNGEAQQALLHLVEDVSSGRNTLQKGKRGEYLRALGEREEKERREREQAEAAKHPKHVPIGGSLYHTVPTHPPAFTWHHHALDPAMDKAFKDVGRALEKAQSAIEDAAWENLRNGECDAEMMKVKDSLVEALSVAHTEVMRWEEKRRERELAVKEGTLLPRMPLVNLVQYTEAPPGVTYNATTAIEVDDEEEEEDDGEKIGITEMIRLGVRGTARVSAR